MSPFDMVLAVCGGVLTLSALAVVYRMVVGPTILDRAISSDSLVTVVVLGMALYTARAEAPWAGPAMLGLTGLAFVGTVTFARFVAREEPRQGYRPAALREPSTDTGPHDAIHPDPETESSPAAADQLPPEDDAKYAAAVDGEPGADRAETEDGTDDSEKGFGAQTGSRGFREEAAPRWPEERTEEDR